MNETDTLRVIDIIEGTSVDGPGLRTSIYFAGCDHHCQGCHNPSTWSHKAGRDMTVDELLQYVEKADFNVTLSGGDPIYQAKKLLPFVKRLRENGRTIWLYTGFTIEQLHGMPDAMALFPYLEAIVDGPYIENMRDTSLRFRGSSNQRIIKVSCDEI